MAFELRRDWPIVAVVLLAIVGLFLVLGAGNNASASAASSGGISPSDAASLMQQSNALAAQLQEGQAQSNQQLQESEIGTIGSIIGDAIGAQSTNAQDSTQAQLETQLAQIQAQAQEYGDYQDVLGEDFGNATNMTTQTTLSGNELQAVLAQINAQQYEDELKSGDLFGIPGIGNLSSLTSLLGL